MKVKKIMKRASACFAVLFFISSIPFAQAMLFSNDDEINWERMVGAIVPVTTNGAANVVGGQSSPGFSWSARRGDARVNLEDDFIRFNVYGLVLAAQNPVAPGNDVVIGVPSPAVPMVKGTLVCDADDAGTATFFDSPAVPLSAQGDARFSGTALVALPATCDNAAFLIRISGGGANNLWIASGMARTP